jgi:low affinity Fe/Cu permease
VIRAGQDQAAMKTQPTTLSDRFNAIADGLTTALGSLPALVGSVLLVVVWALTGPIFNFSDTWQLFINTTTTVVTFWMVFVIQNSANRATKATQLKLDEIIRSLDEARNDFIALDSAPEEVLVEREREFEEIANGGAADAGPGAARAAQRGSDASVQRRVADTDGRGGRRTPSRHAHGTSRTNGTSG